MEENFSEPGITLLSYLRRRLGLCGTKLGCGEGGCGACTVMVSDLQVRNNKTVVDYTIEIKFILCQKKSLSGALILIRSRF